MALLRSLVLTGILVLINPGLYSQPLVISTFPEAAPFSPLIEKVFSAAGLQAKIRVLPIHRSLAYVQSGEVDGEFPRSDLALETMVNVVKVDVPLLSSDYFVYTTSAEQKIGSLQDLETRGYVFLEGSLLDEGFLKTHKVATVQKARDWQTMKDLLALGRSDFAVFNPNDAAFFETSTGLKLYNTGLKVFSTGKYLVLHRKNLRYLGMLEAVLKDWKQSGRLQQEIEAVFRSLTASGR